MATKLNHIQQHLFAGLKKINVLELQKTLIDVYEINITEREIQNYIDVFKDECNVKNSKELSEYIIINEICATKDMCKIKELKENLHEIKFKYQEKLTQVETLESSLNKLKKEHQESQKLSEDRLHSLTDLKEEFANKEFQHQLTIDAYKKRIDKYRSRVFFSLVSIIILIASLIVLLFNM